MGVYLSLSFTIYEDSLFNVRTEYKELSLKADNNECQFYLKTVSSKKEYVFSEVNVIENVRRIRCFIPLNRLRPLSY